MVSGWVEEPQAQREHKGADILIRSLSSSHHQAVAVPLGCDPGRLPLCDKDLI